MIPQIRRIALLALATALIAAGIALAQSQDTAQPDRFQRSFNVKPGSTLRVENYKGTIHVTGTAGNQVVVNVVKRFEGSEADRKEWMQNTKISFNGDSDRVEVKVTYPSQSWSCLLCWSHGVYDSAVELDIQVPRQTNLKIDGYKPDIRIASLQGDIRIESYKAPMTVDSTTGGIHIDTYKDTIKLHNVAVRGDLHVNSYKADLTVDATSLDRFADLSSDKGSVVLRVPANTGLEVDFEGSRRAAFHSDFPMTTQSKYPGHSFRGTINQGGTRLRLRTTKGSVSLEKASGAL